MQPIQKRVGERVRVLREKKGISQEALASTCSLHRTYIGLIERGERNLSLTTVEKIAEGLGVQVSELFAGTEQITTQPRRAAVKERPRTRDLAADIASIRQILIEAKLTDAKRYDALYKTILRKRPETS
jgi:transcriptional regulator with XRE-family HTH domain